MSLNGLSALSVIVLVGAASPAMAEDSATTTPAKPRAVHAKLNPKSPAPNDMGAIEFSDPRAPLGGHAQPGKRVAPSQASTAPKEPLGGAELGLKWRAESRVNNPYWEPWVPNGEGESVQAGVKLGF
jgi:hypothetical protein